MRPLFNGGTLPRQRHRSVSDNLKKDIRRRLLEQQYPRRQRAVFWSDPDHNPLILEDCLRCGGTGRCCSEATGVAIIDTCPDCGGPGWTGYISRYFPLDAGEFRQASPVNGWLSCPWCSRRFSTGDGSVWSGLRHLKCGGRIEVTAGAVRSWSLIDADILRDGGSYSASLVASGNIFSLWLQCSPADDSTIPKYTALYVSVGSDPTLKTTRVPPMGEDSWRAALASAVAHHAVSTIARERAAEFAAILHARDIEVAGQQAVAANGRTSS
jgi:hypothetical protein